MGGEPLPQEPEGESLPEGDLKAIDGIQAIHDAQLKEIAEYLFNDGMDGDWYEDREATHIAVLSSIGKAEHAMRCMNNDIKRYTRLIYRLHEFVNRNRKMVGELNAKRLILIEHQSLVERLHREDAEADRACKELRRQQRLAEESNDSSLTYTATTEGRRIVSTGSLSTHGSQGLLRPEVKYVGKRFLFLLGVSSSVIRTGLTTAD